MAAPIGSARSPEYPPTSLILGLLLSLAVGCQSPPGDLSTLPSDADLPQMSLYCPDGASVEQCIQFERVMEHLRRSPFTKCNLAAERLDYQDENFNNNDVGVWLLGQPSGEPSRYGDDRDIPQSYCALSEGI